MENYEKKTDFQIGDVVKITDSGLQYSDYRNMFIHLCFDNYLHNDCDTGDVGVIFSKIIHPFNDRRLLAISLVNGKQCLIEEDGVIHYSEFYIRGNEERGGEIIDYLERIGFCNISGLSGKEDGFYFPTTIYIDFADCSSPLSFDYVKTSLTEIPLDLLEKSKVIEMLSFEKKRKEKI